MFRANLVLGAFALLALFVLARRVVGSPIGLVVTAAMAVSMPMIYVSRDTYSEPLMMLFLIGGVAMLHRAVTTARRADYGLAGLDRRLLGVGPDRQLRGAARDRRGGGHPGLSGRGRAGRAAVTTR